MTLPARQLARNSVWSIHEESHTDMQNDKKEVNNTNSTESKDIPLKDEKPIQLPTITIVYGLLAGLLVGTVALTIVTAVWMTSSKNTSTTASSSTATTSSYSSTSCIGKETPYHTSIVTALYPFDGNTNDLIGNANGTTFGNSAPSYTSSAYIGSALTLAASSGQYVQIPYINLGQQSFTLQAWLYTSFISIPSDFGIFSQCDSNSICLLLSLRNGRFILSFDSMNPNNYTLTGSTLIGTSTWVHITVVYDSGLRQQKLYVNGRIDAQSSTGVNAYQGTSSGSMTTIGSSISFGNVTSYFTGRIDHFTISAGTARTACQIYNDASLIAYYPFDVTATYNDYSTSLSSGISSGTTVISPGHSGQAISFSSNASYFQTRCFPRMRVNDNSFSFSLWVNPTSTSNGGTLIHISSSSIGTGNCYDLLAFTTTGNLVVQWMTSSYIVNAAQGSVISTNAWTHVAVAYSSSNGVRLYINGQISTSSSNTGNLILLDLSPLQYVTLGNAGASGSLSTSICQNATVPISPGSYSGAIDDFRLYNRELNSQEINDLVNI